MSEAKTSDDTECWLSDLVPRTSTEMKATDWRLTAQANEAESLWNCREIKNSLRGGKWRHSRAQGKGCPYRGMKPRAARRQNPTEWQQMSLETSDVRWIGPRAGWQCYVPAVSWGQTSAVLSTDTGCAVPPGGSASKQYSGRSSNCLFLFN